MDKRMRLIIIGKCWCPSGWLFFLVINFTSNTKSRFKVVHSWWILSIALVKMWTLIILIGWRSEYCWKIHDTLLLHGFYKGRQKLHSIVIRSYIPSHQPPMNAFVWMTKAKLKFCPKDSEKEWMRSKNGPNIIPIRIPIHMSLSSNFMMD